LFSERYKKEVVMVSLEGKTALITGAGRGIGRAIALRLAADGARVAVHYGSSEDGARRVVEEIEAEGGSAFTVRATLGEPGDAAALWSAFDEHADGVDVLVNNAGILGGRVAFPDVEEADYDRVFAVNTRAPFFVAQQALSRLRDHGRIVNVSTRFTHGARNPDLMAYAMSKAAIDAFTSTLAKLLGPRGITVNAVGPGATATDMNAARLATPEGREAMAALSPLHRVAEPSDIADVVAFLASDDARWVTGQWIDASGGSLL
jgi:NAD(P)-dependent dehydrogenase (short-subunit alcohol dehydrogenase family)